MTRRKLWLFSVAFAAVALTTGLVWALGFELGETKDQLGLKYDVAVTGTGRVTVVLTLADDGRLKPLRSVELIIPAEDKSGYADLALSLAVREADGKRTATVQLKRELAERAELRLVTDSLDGKQLGLTWYYHVIRIADHLPPAEPGNPRPR